MSHEVSGLDWLDCTSLVWSVGHCALLNLRRRHSSLYIFDREQETSRRESGVSRVELNPWMRGSLWPISGSAMVRSRPPDAFAPAPGG